MKKTFKKMDLKQKFIVVTSIVIIISVILIIAFKQNSPEKVVKEYCDILVNGNYGDALDIAYFPDSEFITKDKIEELKKVYFEKMKKDNNNITSCTYTKANETDETITYKLTMEKTNGKNTSNIEISKKDNKIMLDGLYKEKSLTVFKGSTVYVDNKEVSIKPKVRKNEGNQVENYVFVILDDVDYKVKITHPIFKDEVTTLDNDTNYTKHTYGYLKDDFTKKLKTDIDEMFTDIVTVTMEGQDIKPLNKYFLNNNAEDFINSNDRFKSIITDASGTYNHAFKSVDKIHIDTIEYINDKEFWIRMYVNCNRVTSAKDGIQIFRISDEGGKFVDSYEDDFGKQIEFTCVKNDGKWKISNWNKHN